MSQPTRRRSTRRHLKFAGAVLASALCLVLPACGGGSAGGSGDQVEITLAGPNQWNNDPKSFGPAWEDLVARFEEKEPNITVNTTVLPIAEFSQTLSTQLTAGTAPELVFNQAPHEAEQVVQLDEYLNKPNPYVEGNEKWIDIFNPEQFGPDTTRSRNAAGHYEWVPFNLVIIGIYYNQEILDEAGVKAPIKTYGEFIDACGKIKSAGYTPFAMDNGWLGQGWTYSTISSMMTAKYAEDLNQFDPDGKPGTSEQVSGKSIAKAVLTGELDPTTTPEVAESLKLLKELFDTCATENWSGIPGGKAFIGSDEFLGGKAAMSFGANFAATNLEEVDWKYGTMAFPTITKEDSPLSSGEPAKFGAAPGGTSYMIPSTTEGEELDAAVKFLQFATSPTGAQPWLDKSGGIPSQKDGEAAPGLEGLMSGDWFKSPVMPALTIAPKAKAGQALYDGYLLGSKPLDAQLKEMKADWVASSKEQVEDGGYTEDWAKK